MKTKYQFILVVLTIFGIILISGCMQESEQIDIPPAAPSSPVTTELYISKAPTLNEPVELTLTINSVIDAPNSEAFIELPEGAIKLEGDLSWEGDLKENVPIQISAKIKFIQEGNLEIKGSAKHVIDESNYWGDIDYIYLCVKEDFGKIGYCETSPGEGAKQTIEEGEEACSQGYEWDGNKCIPIEHEVCPEGFFWNEVSQSCREEEGT